jgi:hypothetical protein
MRGLRWRAGPFGRFVRILYYSKVYNTIMTNTRTQHSKSCFEKLDHNAVFGRQCGIPLPSQLSFYAPRKIPDVSFAIPSSDAPRCFSGLLKCVVDGLAPSLTPFAASGYDSPRQTLVCSPISRPEMPLLAAETVGTLNTSSITTFGSFPSCFCATRVSLTRPHHRVRADVVHNTLQSRASSGSAPHHLRSAKKPKSGSPSRPVAGALDISPFCVCILSESALQEPSVGARCCVGGGCRSGWICSFDALHRDWTQV